MFVRSRSVVVGVAVLTVMAVLAFDGYFWADDKSPFEKAIVTDSEQSAEIRDLINELGPERAYAAVLEKSKTIPAADHHVLGHDYGRAAAQLGIDPEIILATCGTELVYGCLHEFIGQLLYTHGLEYVNELERLCYKEPGLKSYLGCMHGLGHGLLTYVGYDEDKLFEVIKYCDDVFFSESLMGCQGGVFMEYNHRDFIGGPPREVSEDDPYAPCIGRGKYTRACVYWLPQLWQQTSMNTAELMDRCTNFPGTDVEKEACYQGLGGSTVATSTEGYAFTAAACDSMGHVSDDASFACRWRALRSYDYVDEHDFGTPEVRCMGLSGDEYERCAAYVKEKITYINEMVEQLHIKRELTYGE